MKLSINWMSLTLIHVHVSGMNSPSTSNKVVKRTFQKQKLLPPLINSLFLDELTQQIRHNHTTSHDYEMWYDYALFLYELTQQIRHNHTTSHSHVTCDLKIIYITQQFYNAITNISSQNSVTKAIFCNKNCNQGPGQLNICNIREVSIHFP